MKPTLYRHFSEDGTLLYIGASLNFCQRHEMHRDVSPWFDSVVKITLEHFETRADLLTAELEAIKNEIPKNNYAGQRDRQRRVKPPFLSPVPIVPYEEWTKKQKRLYAKLTPEKIMAICKDKRIPSTLRWDWKLDLNTIYFIKEGRVP